MKRFFFFASIVLCSLIPAIVHAQDSVSVRAGAHEKYSRLVFDWDKKVKYALYQSDDGHLNISFEENRALDQSAVDLSKVENIEKVQVLSTQPLKIVLNIPEDSEVKTFFIDTRLVVDVYNPPAGSIEKKKEEPKQIAAEISAEDLLNTTASNVVKPEKQIEKKPEPEKIADIAPAAQEDLEKQAEPKVEPKEVKPESAPIPRQKKDEPAAQETKKEPPAYVLIDENAAHATPPPFVEAEPLETQHHAAGTHKEEKTTPHLNLDRNRHTLTVTSTAIVGMAVFTSGDNLWLVTDVSSPHHLPKILGPNPEIFEGIEEIQPSLGTAYRTKRLDGMNIQGDGGGLMWRVILTEEADKDEPVKPVRKAVPGSLKRGGKIIWPFEKPSRLIELNDPATGQLVKVVTVEESEDFAGPHQVFVDFDVLPSPVGLVIRPKVDDLIVEITDEGVEVSRPGGLAILPQSKMEQIYLEEEKQKKTHGVDEATLLEEGPRIFNFEQWQVSDPAALNWNRNTILGNMNKTDESGKLESLIMLARMNLAHGRGAEAIGFLTYAHQQLPALDKNAEFLALRGVANAFDRKSEVALGDLLNPALRPYEEINYWKAFVLADLGDWQQAADILPEHFTPIYDYPNLISHRLALVLAEVELRAGKVDRAEELLALVEHNKSDLSDPINAALEYLHGEASRQRGQIQKTVDVWQALTKGPDELYRAKAGLALTRLLEENGDIDNKQTIDRLERLRYAWRGDELEAQINYWLALAYLKEKNFVKGLTIMRDAASIAAETPLGRRITEEMAKIFTDLFLGPDLKDISALDTVALYEQFSELTPSGEKGNLLVQKLAEHLVNADLLGRAAQLLQHQVDHRLQGELKAKTAVRLAAIQILDKRPDKALQSLKKAENAQILVPEGPVKIARDRDIDLLKAKALGMAGRADQALGLLKMVGPGADTSRLKADIAWKAGYWQDAAEAFGDVIMDEKITPTTTLSDPQRDLLLNRAIALSLANDRIELANMRKSYSDAMGKTEKAHQFEVITRPRRSGRLADRETLMSVVSEVDLFEDFLKAYKDEVKAQTSTPTPETETQ